LLALNVFLIVSNGRYYGKAFVVGLPALAVGLWMTVTGRAPAGGAPQPLGWQIAFYTVFAVSLAGGLFLAFGLHG
jgi:hypothetical protein